MLIILFLAGAVVSTSAFLEDFFNNDIFNSKNCTADQFRCNNYDCIDKKERCDGTAQCGDLSDEKNCDLFLCTEPNYFKCQNKRCVAKSFVCDGVNDCEDLSDEKNCEDFKMKLSSNSTCQSGEWRCTDHLCIPEEWVCNGEDDCLDGSDEGIGCSKDIKCDGFKCKNHHCIPDEWRCDSLNDCGDNSDEQDCEHHFNINKCTLENRKFLCTDKQNCLDIHRVCDGKPDCLDKSDEAQMCANSKKTCLNAGCSHDCVKLPSGPICLCPVGYHKLDEKTCIDINECEQYDICDQRCRNTQGSYECYCDRKYVLQDDKKSCKAVGGEATMIFSSKNRIRSYLLNSDLYFPVAEDLKQVVGVDYDGNHVYWTDVFAEHESIVRSSEDGSDRELIVTSGLSLPEDIAVDWLTKNIYFTDIQKRHIGVCNNDGSHCTVLVNEDVRKPRAIVLNVNDGTMYWTDWEKPAEIAYAEMDGSNHRPFLKDDIHWPNGLALDYPNSRLYWTDAKKMTLESIRLDGTDRRVVLKGIAKHPFSISVFENKLYWSDWETKSIEVCDKFSGKEHRTLIKEDKEFVYGISIFHSALHERSENPCSLAFCTDICLLKATGYSCACSEGRVLSNDKHTCKDIFKKQMIVGATSNYLLRIEHKALGRHIATVLPSIVKNAGSITYDGHNNTLYVSDLNTKRIVSLNMHTYDVKYLPIMGLGKITSMDYDSAGNNLFMCDTEKATLEVVSLTTMSRKVLIHDFQDEIPQSVAVIPEEGILFIAITNKVYESAHIDRMYMDGSGRTHVIENGLVGPISLHYDSQVHRVFFSDGGTGDIESTSVEGDDRHVFRSLHSIPVDITTLNSDLFWVNKYSRRLYWSDKQNGEFNQKITLDIPNEIDQIHLTSVTPTKTVDSLCQVNNGNCSHLCLPIHKSVICACPSLMSLDDDQITCVHRLDCEEEQFKCPLSRMCVAKKLRCDGKKDCHRGEDEEECQKERTHCPSSYFQCNDGACIFENQVCDHHYDCKDKSDEHNCHSKTESCPPDHFRCENDRCIADRFVCDGANDCNDNSDEENCLSTTCADNQFRCDSGTCIPKSWECDHEYDCQDFSDEHTGCVNEGCPSNMFQCSNGKCLDKKLVCDYSDDCGDHSDEQNCYSHRLEDSCAEGQFSCTSKPLCLNMTARCNGTFECPGHEDERDCSNCGEDNFECKNKKCIPIQWLCDGSDDCGDHSDEDKDLCKAVDHKSMPQLPSDHVACDDGFRCKTGACVNLTALCDKNHDCYDGSDEDGLCSRSCDTLHNPCDHKCLRTPVGPMCHCQPGFSHEDKRDCSNCGEDNFEYKNKKCIPIQWLCDGSDDCGDHSDEDKNLCEAVDHKSMPQLPSDHVACDDGFRCKTGACVNLTALCDKNHDCYDGSDEDGLCSRLCDTLHNSCDHKCLRTPVGPMCHCQPGFRLMGDGHSCLDVNECNQDPAVCSQLCINQEGSYMCDCYDGFMLRPDKKSCKAEGAPMSLIYTTDNQIRQLTQKSNSLTVLYSEEMPKITSLTVDMKKMTIYFTLDHSNTIQRINLNSKKREYMEHLGQPQKIAYDWATGHIYYFNAQSDSKSISVCNFEDMQCGKLIDIDVHRYVSELTVDSVNKVMFYSLTSWWIFNSPSYVLYKVNLDGTEPHEMVRSSSGYITGLTFDSNKKTLYYMDQHQGQIMSINYEDNTSHVLFSNLTRPTGLKFFENNLYYATTSGKITKCQVYGAKECDSFKIHSYALQHFTIVQDGLQPPTKNVCEDHKCSYLCVANKVDYTCLCEDGRVAEKNQECGNIVRASFNEHRPEFHSIDLPSDDSSGKSSGAVTSVIVLTFLVLIIGACLFIYAKKRNHGTFNVSMRFKNSGYDKHVDEFENPILSNDGKVEFTNETLERFRKQDNKKSEKDTSVTKDVRFCITEPDDSNEDETVNFLDL